MTSCAPQIVETCCVPTSHHARTAKAIRCSSHTRIMRLHYPTALDFTARSISSASSLKCAWSLSYI
jgi:hypothetical protein